MTISEIVKKVKRKMFLTNKVAIVKWLTAEGQTKYGVLYKFKTADQTGDNGFGIALALDEDYHPIVYPSTAANKYEFVGLESHNAFNNVFKKYKMRKEYKNEIPYE